MTEKYEEETPNQIKVIILGSVGVGKTSLVTRYKTKKFVKNITSTSGSNFVIVEKTFNNKKYLLNIWDTAGQEKYNSLTQTFIQGSKIIILVYSIIEEKSFNDLDSWLKLVKDKIGEKGYSIGIAANKSDLYAQSQVSDIEGKKYAKKINAAWKLTSALEANKGIDDLIDELLMSYLIIEEKEGFNCDDTIKLDNSSFNENKKGGCCKGKKKKNKNDIRNKSRHSYLSMSASDDKDPSVF